MSPEPAEHRLGPFVESGRKITNIGYRDVLTGRVVSSVEIPSELIERTVIDNVSVEIALLADGRITSAATGSASASSSKKMIHLDELVEALLAVDNLHMEETTVFDLKGLLERLEKSVRAVQHSVALLEHSAIEPPSISG